MDYQDLINQPAEELERLLQEAEGKLHLLRQKGLARSLKQVHEPKVARRTIARIRTILNTRAHAIAKLTV